MATEKNVEAVSEFERKLTEGLSSVVDEVRTERQRHHARPNAKQPTVADVNPLIRGYSATNAALAGALNLIPGPWGLVAIVPELILLIRNQLSLIYDIGVAYGRERFMTNELLLGVLVSSIGGGGLGLITIHGQKLLVKRAALRVMQKVIAWLGGKITQRVLKQFLVRFLPGVGAAAMAGWAYYTTNAVGTKAVELLSGEVEFEGEADDIFTPEERGAPPGQTVEEFEADLTRRRVIAFMNLMNADGKRRPAEVDYIHAFITNAGLEQADDLALRRRVKIESRLPVDLSPFRGRADDAAVLLLELVALALRDGELHPKEVAYIHEVATAVGVPSSEVESMIADAMAAEADVESNEA